MTESSRIAILTVYVVRSEIELQVLRVHLERVQRHTGADSTHYVVTHRATPEAVALITAQPHTVCPDVVPTELRGGREHAYYLDALTKIALDDGATGVIALDADAFPIDDGWIDALTLAAGESGVAGILRVENGDRALPHPSCTLLRRDFIERFHPTFSPDSDRSPEFRRFSRATGQSGDTGIRIAATLWNNGIEWGRLRRTNRRDVHYLIAGIYGDVVFHLGAGSRVAIFRRDRMRSASYRITRPLERIPVRSTRLLRWRARVIAGLRRPSEQRIIATNRSVTDRTQNWLITDPDGMIEFLRTGHTGPDTPAWAIECNELRGTSRP